MRRSLKVAIWGLVFAAFAGAGAWVAAHTDPFPPGVDDPGARPSASGSVSATPAIESQTWRLVVRSATRHELHVGGSCRSSWLTDLVLTMDEDGSLAGEGPAAFRSGGCDFEVAQVQARSVHLVVTGSLDADVLRLRFGAGALDPVGSQDLGGLAATLDSLRPALRLSDGRGEKGVSVSRSDGDQGRWVAAHDISVVCQTGCA